MDRETIFDHRAMITLGLVQLSDDGGQAQTVQVQTHDGVVRDDIEVMQPFGFASRPPGDGALAPLLAVGGDPANIVSLPLVCPSVRFGGLANGEAVMYAADGTRVALRQGGTVEVWAATAVIVNSQTVSVTAPAGVSIAAAAGVTITAAAGVTIDGNVQVNGSLVASGDISDQDGAHGTMGELRTAYDAHAHPDPQGGTTGTTDHPV